jgi:hypothetical protein
VLRDIRGIWPKFDLKSLAFEFPRKQFAEERVTFNN